jgi:DUF1680 family protein
MPSAKRLLVAGPIAAASLTAALIPGAASSPAPQAPARLGREYPVRPVPFTAVRLKDDFWAPRIETNRVETIPFAFKQCELTGRVDNFVRAARVIAGQPLDNVKPPGYPFDDTDVYKVIEGASYALSVRPDPALDAYVDGLIARIAAAQERDGYLYTTRTINPQQPHPWAGKARWELERDDSHELYNLGHLFEAAVAHYQATRKRTLLDVAIKGANLLVETFGPGKRSIWPGHQITEMGLVRLYRVTGDERYLTLARFLLDERGPNPGEKVNPRGLIYNQAHARVIEQTEPVGHAVRAMYMYAGMADVAALTGDRSYVKAIDTIWSNTVTRKLYLTGGIGATGAGEAFGAPYELPNMTAYNETCAAIGMDYWNHRLFLLHGDARYIDVMERTLYNGLISGVSLDGKSFFYPNPLESNGQHARSPWFGVACCPGNMTRFLASLPGYVYAVRGTEIFVNLYVQGDAALDLDEGPGVRLSQETRYPWDGAVRILVNPSRPAAFSVKLRIPGWARDEPVPGDLYRFADASPKAPSVSVNGQPAALALDKGFVTIARTWQAGDTIALDLPMPVRRVYAHENVAADRNRVALQRGPIVYAAEWPDNRGGKVRNIVLGDTAPLSSEFRPSLLGGVQVLTGRARGVAYDANGGTTASDQDFVAIPYATWANRGRGQMAVWLARTDAAARPTPWPTIATASRVTTSESRQFAGAVNDGEEPHASGDAGSSFDWWPRKGTTEWIQYAFAKPARVTQVEVYWFDDTGHGEVRVPASWRVLYDDGGTWRPVETTDAYGVAPDRYHRVRFSPVTTGGLRLEVTLQAGWSAGVQEWKVQ